MCHHVQVHTAMEATAIPAKQAKLKPISCQPLLLLHATHALVYLAVSRCSALPAVWFSINHLRCLFRLFLFRSLCWCPGLVGLFSLRGFCFGNLSEGKVLSEYFVPVVGPFMGESSVPSHCSFVGEYVWLGESSVP